MSDSPYSGAALRQSALHFLTGKAASGLLSLALLLVLVRVLPTRDYGMYATLVAWFEVTVAVAGLGIPWIGGRFVPEFRLHGSGIALSGLCSRLLRWLIGSLALAVPAAGALLQPYLEHAGLGAYRPAALLYLAVMFAEGLYRTVTASLLDPLMQQQVVRRALILRQGSFLGLLAVAHLLWPVKLVHVVVAEIAASVLGVSIGLFGLRRCLAQGAARCAVDGWAQPALPVMWRAGLHMYGAYLLTLPYSPQVMLTLVTRTLGVEAAAAFGFLRALYSQIANYLPATLMFTVLRPKLIAGYVAQGDAGELTRNANLAGKLSLFVLLPLIAFIGATGAPLVSWLSGGRMPDTGRLFLGFALVLIPLSQRQLLETVAVAVGHSQLCVLAAAAGILALPAFAATTHAGMGLWAAVVAIGLGQLLFNGTIVGGLRLAVGYRVDGLGALKLALAAAVACAAAAFVPADGHKPLLLVLGVQAMVVAGVFLAVAWWIKPLDSLESARVYAFLKRSVFFR